MSSVVEEFNLNGCYSYGGAYTGRLGKMNGMAVRYDDGRLVGVMTDKDMSGPEFKQGFSRYLFGQFHSLGLSFIKFDSFGSIQNPIHWAFEKQGDEYTGCWRGLGISPFTIMLKSIPHLQAAASLENLPELASIFEREFTELIEYGRKVGQIGKIKLTTMPSGQVRNELRL